MPRLRKLSPEEVRAMERKRVGVRRATAAEYDALLANFDIGDYGEVELEPGEARLTVRNRMKAAAARRDPPIRLTFLRGREGLLRFTVSAAEAPAASSSGAAVGSDTPPKRPGRPAGRSRKT
jgi:hypothetical protein